MINKLSISIGSISAVGIEPQTVLKRLTTMKKELERLGCQVSISVAGQEVDQIQVLTLDNCPECQGTGQIGMDDCESCNGSGVRGEWV